MRRWLLAFSIAVLGAACTPPPAAESEQPSEKLQRQLKPAVPKPGGRRKVRRSMYASFERVELRLSVEQTATM
jgi:hypothetical protein